MEEEMKKEDSPMTTEAAVVEEAPEMDEEAIKAAEKKLSNRFAVILAVLGCEAAVFYGLWVFGIIGK